MAALVRCACERCHDQLMGLDTWLGIHHRPETTRPTIVPDPEPLPEWDQLPLPGFEDRP